MVDPHPRYLVFRVVPAHGVLTVLAVTGEIVALQDL
jgi:hypothetical protein